MRRFRILVAYVCGHCSGGTPSGLFLTFMPWRNANTMKTIRTTRAPIPSSVSILIAAFRLPKPQINFPIATDVSAMRLERIGDSEDALELLLRGALH